MRSSHLIPLDFITLMILNEEEKSRSSSKCNFFSSPFRTTVLDPDISSASYSSTALVKSFGNHTRPSSISYLTSLLTPWCRVLLEKLTGLQLVKKFPAYHGTRMFITTLTSVRQLSLSWTSPIQSIYPHPTSWRSILILFTHLRLGLPSGLLPSGFPTKTLYTPSPHPYAPHAQSILFFYILSLATVKKLSCQRHPQSNTIYIFCPAVTCFGLNQCIFGALQDQKTGTSQSYIKHTVFTFFLVGCNNILIVIYAKVGLNSR